MPGDDIGLKVRIDTEANPTGVEETKGALGGLKDEVRGAGTEVRALGSAGLGLERAMTGLRIGGIQGLVIALRGLGMTIRAVSATMSGSFIGMTAAVFAPIAAAILLIKYRAEEMAAANLKTMADQKTTAEAYHKKVEEIDAAEKVWLTAQIKLVSQLTERWDELANAMGRSDKAARELEDAQHKLDVAKLGKAEATALAGAKPEERAAISEGFAKQRADLEESHAAWELDQTRVRAGLKSETARQELEKTQKQLDEADARAKRLTKTSATEISEKEAALGPGWAATLTPQERNKFLADKVAAEAARKSADELQEKTHKLRGELGEAVADENQAQKLYSVEKETAAVSRQTRGVSFATKDRDIIAREKSPLTGEAAKLEREKASLEGELETMSAGRLTSGRLTSGTEYEQADATKAKLDDTQRALDILNSSIGDFATAAARKMRKTSDQLVNQRDQAPTVY